MQIPGAFFYTPETAKGAKSAPRGRLEGSLYADLSIYRTSSATSRSRVLIPRPLLLPPERGVRAEPRGRSEVPL